MGTLKPELVVSLALESLEERLHLLKLKLAEESVEVATLPIASEMYELPQDQDEGFDFL